MSHTALHRQRRLQPGERGGVILFLLALISVGIGVVVVLLAVDSVVIWYASTQLREITEVACRRVAWNPVVQRTAARMMRDEVNRMVSRGLPQYAQITGVNFYDLTMPRDSRFEFPEREANGTIPYVQTPTPFAALLGSGCDLGSRWGSTGNSGVGGSSGGGSITHPPPIDCMYFGNLSTADIAEHFPSVTFQQTADIGSQVGCEIQATVTGTILYGESPIVARVLWKRPPNGKHAEYDPNDPIRTSAALTVVIAPEGATQDGDPRDVFYSGWQGSPGDIPRAMFDPLFAGNGGPIDGFQSEPASESYSGYLAVKAPALSAATRWESINSRNVLVDNSFGLPFSSYADPATRVLSDAQSRLSACITPRILFRNLFAGVVMEYAARHGQLRRMTELLIANPKHRDVGDYESLKHGLTVSGPDPIGLNPPAQVISFGSDIAIPQYKIPAVFWDTGAGTDGTIHKNGALNPFVPATGLGSITPSEMAWKQHQAMVAWQLADCYHLWRSTSRGGLDVPALDAVYQVLDNTNFENPALYSPADAVYPASYADGKPRAQQCVFGSAGCTADTTQQLTGSQIAEVLSSIQDCPYEQRADVFSRTTNSTDDPNYPGGLRICHKPAAMCADTSSPADLAATLLYIARRQTTDYFPALGGNDFAEGSSNAVPAVQSPGIFPVTSPRSGRLPFLTGNASEDGRRYALAQNLNSTVVLFLDRAIDPRDVPTLRSIVDDNFRERPISVIFIPNVAVGSSEVENLVAAFHAGPGQIHSVHYYGPNSFLYGTAAPSAPAGASGPNGSAAPPPSSGSLGGGSQPGGTAPNSGPGTSSSSTSSSSSGGALPLPAAALDGVTPAGDARASLSALSGAEQLLSGIGNPESLYAGNPNPNCYPNEGGLGETTCSGSASGCIAGPLGNFCYGGSSSSSGGASPVQPIPVCAIGVGCNFGGPTAPPPGAGVSGWEPIQAYFRAWLTPVPGQKYNINPVYLGHMIFLTRVIHYVLRQ